MSSMTPQLEVSGFLVLALLLTGCAFQRSESQQSFEGKVRAAEAVMSRVSGETEQQQVYQIGVCCRDGAIVLTGIVDRVESKVTVLRALQAERLKALDQVELVPSPELASDTWGLACLSVASAREGPDHKHEMAMQVLMGETVRVLKSSGIWYLVQSRDGYIAWLEKGSIVRCTEDSMRAWTNSGLAIVTAMEGVIYSKPDIVSEPVSDVVIGNLLRIKSRFAGWSEVEIPDGRTGWMQDTSLSKLATWSEQRQPTPENLERTARWFLGRPYLWGGNSPKGVDCSGFTKLVFYLNGVDLLRNAKQQAAQGTAVPTEPDLRALKTGDLLFFGRRGQDDESPPRITHVGIYLGDKLFIHASERVQINSLDPDSPLRDDHRIRRLLFARRLLP